MSSSKNSGPQQQFLKITQHDKFFSRLLSKESSLANPSFRVYYGGASGAVPFLWESQPGTPKNTIPTSALPPLTPPPSYHFSPQKKKNTNKSNLIHSILPKLTPKKTHMLPSAPSVSPSSSSVSSSGSSGSHRRSWFSSPQSSFSSRADDEDSVDGGSPTSTLCLGMRQGGNGGLRGCYSMVIMKNALLSIVGHGSSQGTAA